VRPARTLGIFRIVRREDDGMNLGLGPPIHLALLLVDCRVEAFRSREIERHNPLNVRRHPVGDQRAALRIAFIGFGPRRAKLPEQQENTEEIRNASLHE